MIRIIIARSSSERDAVLRLRHQVFVGQEARFTHPSSCVVDRYDCLNETFSILAYDGAKPVATFRITLDNPVGLPAAEVFDFRPVMSGTQGKWCSGGWLASLRSHRHHPGLVLGMFKLATRKIRQADNRHVIATVHPPILSMLQPLGFRAAGEVFQAPELGVPMLPCYVDTHAFPPGAREAFEDPERLILDDSDERRIYQRDETIFHEGEPGDTAFVVMRGSVRALAPSRTPEAREILFGQGQLVGEVSLLDGGPRTSTVVAHSSQADVMVWHRDAFLEQLRCDRGRAIALCVQLASRLRCNIEGTMAAPPSKLLARVLLDASRRGEQPVSADWLSRQCGVWIQDIAHIVSGWAERGLLRDDGGRILVLAPDALNEVAT